MHLIWVILLTGLAAHSTMLALHCSRMWGEEHYQFFPVAFVAAGYIAFLRRSELVYPAIPFSKERSGITRSPEPGATWVTLCLLIAVSLTLFIAILLNLALTGWLSFLLFLATMVYAGYGFRGLRAMLPAFIVLLIIKPLPGFSEQSVTIAMQKIASWLASSMLDAIGVVHYSQGVILVLPEKAFMAEEACSGIRSLFSSITAIVVWGFLHRYHWFRHILNVLQTIFWVILFNAIRIAIVVTVEDRTSFNLSEGFPHDVLGFCIFFVIFGMVLSTDQLFASVIEPSIPDEAEYDYAPAVWQDWFIWPNRWAFSSPFVVGFCFMTFLAWRLIFLMPDYKDWYKPEDMPAPLAEHFPQEILGWQVIGFENVDRPEKNIQGQHSSIWKLKKDEKEILVSIDGTFNEFHDLSWCYSALGWRCDSERQYTSIVDRAKGKLDPTSERTVMRLTKPSGENGLVLFTGIDRDGSIVIPPPMIGQETTTFVRESTINALRFAFFMETTEGLRSTTFAPPVSNIQLVYFPAEKLEQSEVEELTKLFIDSREILRRSPRFSTRSSQLSASISGAQSQ